MDKALAGQIGRLLDKRGQTAFLAHDDIKPTVKFELEIMRRLETCTALVAVITPNFTQSSYANQEIGFALARGKPVIMLRFDKGELPGFVKSTQAINTSEIALDGDIEKVIETAEENLRVNYTRPKNFTFCAEVIDSRLEQRREPYWRVTVRPGGAYSFIKKSNETDKWFSQSSNLSESLMYMETRTTPRGWTFTGTESRFGELTDTGDFCYGRSIHRGEQVDVQTGVLMLTRSVEWALKVYQKFGFNSQQFGPIYAELKLGRAHGQKLSVQRAFAPWEEDHTTDEAEVVEGKNLTLDNWLMDWKTPIELIIIQFCRSFGISLEAASAKKLVAPAL